MLSTVPDDPEALASGPLFLPRVIASPQAFSHTASPGGAPALDPAPVEGEAAAGGFFSYDYDVATWSVARCLSTAGFPRPVAALGLAGATERLIDKWFDPPPLRAARAVSLAERSLTANVQHRRELWDLLSAWPALLEAHRLHATFDDADAGPPIVSYDSVSSLDPVVIRDAIAANAAGLAGLRAAKRCVLSDIEYGGDSAARLHDAMCALDAHLARMLVMRVITVNAVSHRRGGSVVLPFVGTFLAFALAHHVVITPPRPYPVVNLLRRADDPSVPPPATLASLHLRPDRLAHDKHNNLILDPVTRLPMEKLGKKSSGAQARVWALELQAKAEAHLAALHAEAYPTSPLLDPSWWVRRGPCRSCTDVGIPCIACIGSEADPRRHTVGTDPSTGLPIMVDCESCKRAVDAAEAAGETVVGVGLGGPGGHCDAAIAMPGACYCSAPPAADAPHVPMASSALAALPASAPAAAVSPSSSAFPAPSAPTAPPTSPPDTATVAGPYRGPGLPPRGLLRPEPYFGYKECRACFSKSHNYNVLCTDCTVQTGVAHIHDDVHYCPHCHVLFAVECPFAHSWGCGSRPGVPGVVPVDVTEHELYIVDAMGRMANPLLSVELRLLHQSRAPKHVRTAWLLAAVKAFLSRLVANSPLARIIAAVVTPPPLPTPGSGPAALWGVDPRNPLLALSTPAYYLPGDARPHPLASPAATLGVVLAAARLALTTSPADEATSATPADEATSATPTDEATSTAPAGNATAADETPIPIDGFDLPVGFVPGRLASRPSDAAPLLPPPSDVTALKVLSARTLKVHNDMRTFESLCKAQHAAAEAEAASPAAIAIAHQRLLTASLCTAEAALEHAAARDALGAARGESGYERPSLALRNFHSAAILHAINASAEPPIAQTVAMLPPRAAAPSEPTFEISVPPAAAPVATRPLGTAAPLSPAASAADDKRIAYARRTAGRAPDRAPDHAPARSTTPPPDGYARRVASRPARSRSPSHEPRPDRSAFDPDAIVSRADSKWFEHADGRWSIRGGRQRFVFDSREHTTECLPDDRWRTQRGLVLWALDHRQRWLECPRGGIPPAEVPVWLDYVRRSDRDYRPPAHQPEPPARDRPQSARSAPVTRDHAVPRQPEPAAQAQPATSSASHPRDPAIDYSSPTASPGGKWTLHRDGLYTVRGEGELRLAWHRDGKTTRCYSNGHWRRTNRGRNLWALDHHRRWVECPPGGLSDHDLPAWLASLLPAPAAPQPQASEATPPPDPDADPYASDSSHGHRPRGRRDRTNPDAADSDTDHEHDGARDDEPAAAGSPIVGNVDSDSATDELVTAAPDELADEGSPHIGYVNNDPGDEPTGDEPSIADDDALALGTSFPTTGGAPSLTTSDSDYESATEDAPAAPADDGSRAPQVTGHLPPASAALSPTARRTAPGTPSPTVPVARPAAGPAPTRDVTPIAPDEVRLLPPSSFPGYRTWSTLILAPAHSLAAAEHNLAAAFAQAPTSPPHPQSASPIPGLINRGVLIRLIR